MDRTGKHHSEQGQPGLEDQKLCVLPHMRTLDLGQMQQHGWTWITGQGESTYERYGIGRKPKT
jgi:hypothetical protein